MTEGLLKHIKSGDIVKFKYGNTKTVEKVERMRVIYIYFTDGSYDRYFNNGEYEGFSITGRKDIIKVYKEE